MKFCKVSDPLSLEKQEAHPLASHAKVLLTSVFAPYARDDEYGSRSINPMELYHNQVTRVQGPFSLRMFHRSCGLMLIQANIDAPCTLLDYPTLDRLEGELKTKRYDIVGISAIPPNLKKVQKMCSVIRQHQPDATIVVGGHIANMAHLDQKIDADWVVRGDGVAWFRNFLGDGRRLPIRHPLIVSAIHPRFMGLNLSTRPVDVAAVLIPSVGCPMGCNFCSTSAMFGGKGHHVNFYETGDELFRVMCRLEKAMRIRSFMVMDENFMLNRKRALRLLDLMREHEKSWSLYIFSSADVMRSYSMEQLVGLGISWVWIGLESKDSRYRKVEGVDTLSLIKELQSNGIRVIGSTIIGLEHHTPENIDSVIEWAVSHRTEFHQFMLYTAVHGTPLRAELEEKGLILDESEIEEADIHGQFRFNYRHAHIGNKQETEYLLRAFRRDYEANGPSVLRVLKTQMNGWLKYKNHPESRIRLRFEAERKDMPVLYSGALWAATVYFKDKPNLLIPISKNLTQIHREFGFKSRLAAPIVGSIILYFLALESRRIARGHTYEPPTFYEASAKSVAPD
jgi:radical SAM superfamily enzyme YgiQ (UPF0313 family)